MQDSWHLIHFFSPAFIVPREVSRITVNPLDNGWLELDMSETALQWMKNSDSNHGVIIKIVGQTGRQFLKLQDFFKLFIKVLISPFIVRVSVSETANQKLLLWYFISKMTNFAYSKKRLTSREVEEPRNANLLGMSKCWNDF